jgi:hypothetical protein
MMDISHLLLIILNASLGLTIYTIERIALGDDPWLGKFLPPVFNKRVGTVALSLWLPWSSK